MSPSQYPRISFGIIVVNGEPFTRYCLQSIYPFAYEIIIVEGGDEGARAVTTPDGHSVDSTCQSLINFKQNEDPENKIQIISRNSHWPQKDELGRDRTIQSRAYAERATGDYLWQVDIDEFYKPEDILKVIELLKSDPSITAVSFMTHTFWGSPDYSIDGWNFRRGYAEFHRLFKWGPGYKYATHEPPTINDEQGKDLRSQHWVRGKTLARQGIFMYHYALVFPWQVKQKTLLYHEEKPEDCAQIIQWSENSYFSLKKPYQIDRIYQMPSWLQRYQGSHPPQILKMFEDINQGVIQVEQREKGDVEKLLDSRWYPMGIFGLKVWNFFDFPIHQLRGRLQLGRILRWLKKSISQLR